MKVFLKRIGGRYYDHEVSKWVHRDSNTDEIFVDGVSVALIARKDDAMIRFTTPFATPEQRQEVRDKVAEIRAKEGLFGPPVEKTTAPAQIPDELFNELAGIDTEEVLDE